MSSSWRAPTPIRVLESFPEPRESTNPYITQLRQALASTPGLRVVCWTWKGALVGRYDVFHAHWAEALIAKRGVVSTIGRRILFALFLLRLWATRTPVVQTAHNLDLPTGISRVERALLAAAGRLTVVRITLNKFTPVPRGVESVLIEHGHYRDWFSQYAEPCPVPGRVVFVGKVRRYKNVEGLIRAFSALPNSGQPYSLHVTGNPSSEDLVRRLTCQSNSDDRITLRLEFVSDADFVREVGESQLVVLPYHEMHNSGTVLAALSLDRAVLVPDNDFNRALAAEVGGGWVMTFSGDLDAGMILAALQTVESGQRESRPNLHHREWGDAGIRHRAAFRDAIARRSRRRSSTSN